MFVKCRNIFDLFPWKADQANASDPTAHAVSDMQREMRLLGIEPDTAIRDLFTFECRKCATLEVRGVSTA